MEYTSITLQDEIEKAISTNNAALIYFSAPHCNVCKVLKPKLAEMFQDEFPEIKLFYVDVENAPVLSGQFSIFTIPTILVFFEAKEYMRKSRNIGLSELERELERPYRLLFEN
ncbi:MAG: thioredoxin family protein [bacterium]